MYTGTSIGIDSYELYSEVVYIHWDQYRYSTAMNCTVRWCIYTGTSIGIVQL